MLLLNFQPTEYLTHLLAVSPFVRHLKALLLLGTSEIVEFRILL